MRVESLSHHGEEQLQQAQQQVRQAEDAAITWQTAGVAAADEVKNARRAKPLWKRILSVSTAEERQAAAYSQQVQAWVAYAQHDVHQANRLVAQRTAGVAGEDSLAWALSGLSDDWTLLRGYRNRRGETDHVLVGPLGIWAIEVKLRRVRLHVAGEQWWVEKLDRFGNTVGTELAVDRGGRIWARQVTDVAEDLAAWLDRNQHPVPIRTAVIIMHPQAELGGCTNLTVDFVGTQPAQLIHELQRRAVALDADSCTQILELIRRDHRHHHSRRKRRSS